MRDSYSINEPSYFNYSCSISNFSNGRSYAWEWLNETIMIDSVYILYYYNYPYIGGGPVLFFFFGCYIGVPVIIGLIIKKVNRRRKRLRTEKTEEYSG